MKLERIITFRDDLFFDGAVQIDWFENQEKAKLVSESFVFHSSAYFGVANDISTRQFSDTVSFVTKLVQKVNDETNTMPLTLAIAGYGTGKSHLAVTLAQLFSGKNYMPDTYAQITSNIKKLVGSEEAIEAINSASERPNLVLTLNGMRDFNLHSEILKAASKSLKLYGYSDEKLRKINRTLDTAHRFIERNSINNINLFEEYAKTYNWFEPGKTLISKIEENLATNQIAFDIVNKVYEHINGHEIRWDEGISAGTVLTALLNEYCGLSGEFNKIIIIFDEFGRYLEYASNTSGAISGDSALQQIFECIQNAEGNIQMINFIQSDIKTYLQRIDATSNISRYIGRYEVSEKVYLSSNLETIFANLIERSDKEAFDSLIVKKIDSESDYWNEMFTNLNRWAKLDGIWNNQNQFRKVIVEGIYPLHPISTLSLTRLSDYLQNRSSLTLLHDQIEKIGTQEVRVEGELPIVYPSKILNGPLFEELLSAENEGRQRTSHCIRLDGIIRKFDRLTEEELDILRANLLVRLLRFNFRDQEDAMLCIATSTGYSLEYTARILDFLENELGIIRFDDHSNVYDFIQDSVGALDFRTFYKQLASSNSLPNNYLEQSYIREKMGVLSNLSTDFGTNNHITTSEWQFTQDLMYVEDINDTYIKQKIDYFTKAISPDQPKGQVIWAYSSKKTSIESIELVEKQSKKIKGYPIVIMLINDIDAKLESAMFEHFLLSNKMKEQDILKYQRFYNERLIEVNKQIEFSVDFLKKERLLFQNGIKTQYTKRLITFLTEIFEHIYTNPISFSFDGFNKNMISKAKKNYCSILKLLLSGNVNSNVIQSHPIEIRNRLAATLANNDSGSWKAINANMDIVPPTELKIRKLYDYYESKLKSEKEVKFNELFQTLLKPPYGMNEYSVLYFFTILVVNLSYCSRLQIGKEKYSTVNWRDRVVYDNKVDLNQINNTKLIFVEVDLINKRFEQLFNRIQKNKDINAFPKLKEDFDAQLRESECPTVFLPTMQLAKYQLEDGLRMLSEWQTKVLDYEGKSNHAMSEGDEGIADVIKLLSKDITVELVQVLGNEKFKNYQFPSNDVIKIKSKQDEMKRYLTPRLEQWVSGLYCERVESKGKFEAFMKSVSKSLDRLGFVSEAQAVRQKLDDELERTELIQARSQFKLRYDEYMREQVPARELKYIVLLEKKKQGYALIKEFKEYLILFGKGAQAKYDILVEKYKTYNEHLKRLDERIKILDDDINMISSKQSIDEVLQEIDAILQKGIPFEMKIRLEEFTEDLLKIRDEVSYLSSLAQNRNEYSKRKNALLSIFGNDDSIYKKPIINICDMLEQEVNKAEDEWVNSRFLQINDDLARERALRLIDDFMSPPAFISSINLVKIKEKMEILHHQVSEANIGDVLHHFKKLDEESKLKCIEMLKNSMDKMN